MLHVSVGKRHVDTISMSLNGETIMHASYFTSLRQLRRDGMTFRAVRMTKLRVRGGRTLGESPVKSALGQSSIAALLG